MRFALLPKALAGCLFLAVFIAGASAQPRRSRKDSPVTSPGVLLQIIRAGDERRWDNTLPVFLLDKNPNIRKRATLAMGRIGNAEALPALLEVLKTDPDTDVRQMIVFAIGEIESPEGAPALIEIVDDTRAPAEVRARAVEALGKIGAALLNDATTSGGATDKRVTKIRLAILDALKFEAGRRSAPDRSSILLGLAAALRTKPDVAGQVIARFLGYADPRIVADALNALARLRLKDGNDEARELLVKHSDPVVRANAARVLGASEDKQAFDALLDRALHDSDLRVRVSAIRALGSLKNARAAESLLARGATLLERAKSTHMDLPRELNEVLEIVNAIGTLLRNTRSDKAVTWLRGVRALVGARSPEIEVALARVDPELYITEEAKFGVVESPASMARGLQEIAILKKDQPALERSSKFLPAWMHDLISCRLRHHANIPSRITRAMPAAEKCLQPMDVPPFLEAYAAFKPDDLAGVLSQQLREKDVVVRATSAELLGQQPATEANARALMEALPRALTDKDLNDAALAILEALAKQKSDAANQAIKSALDSSDHLVRSKAVTLLRANGAGDFSSRIGTVKTRNTDADYRRAIARIGKKIAATVVTSRGSFVIEFLPEEAPLTVDNFIQLAKKGFFNGQTIPRVVPNFVIQAGDPRGDTNGGPGYQIRCEINEVPYERGAVGMALSGKDTGGSQWFVTHSPQPHLDGGYTVFGHVIRGMEVVDNIARGDVISRVVINER